MCLSFKIATPTFAENQKDIEIATADLAFGSTLNGYTTYGAPIVLLKNVGTVLDGD
jgi:hypothetical protein